MLGIILHVVFSSGLLLLLYFYGITPKKWKNHAVGANDNNYDQLIPSLQLPGTYSIEGYEGRGWGLEGTWLAHCHTHSRRSEPRLERSGFQMRDSQLSLN